MTDALPFDPAPNYPISYDKIGGRENVFREGAKGAPALLYATVDDLVNDGWVMD